MSDSVASLLAVITHRRRRQQQQQQTNQQSTTLHVKYEASNVLLAANTPRYLLLLASSCFPINFIGAAHRLKQNKKRSCR